MTPKNTTLFKIIATLSLALCGLSSWYYLEHPSPAEHTHSSSPLVAPQANYMLASNFPNNIFAANPTQFDVQKIVTVVSIVVVLALIIYLLHVKGIIHLNRTPTRQLLPKKTIKIGPVHPIGNSNRHNKKKRDFKALSSHKRNNGAPKSKQLTQHSKGKSSTARHYRDIKIAYATNRQPGLPVIPVYQAKAQSNAAHTSSHHTKDVVYSKPALPKKRRKRKNKQKQHASIATLSTAVSPSKAQNEHKFYTQQDNRDQIPSQDHTKSAIDSQDNRPTSYNPTHLDSTTNLLLIEDKHPRHISAKSVKFQGNGQQKGYHYSKNSLVRDINLLEEQNDLLYDYLENNLISIVEGIIKGKYQLAEVTPYAVEIFNTLTTPENDLAAGIKQRWDKFRHAQKSITIDMEDIYQYYALFRKSLFSGYIERENLLRFDKVVEIFPNATQIICKHTDCIKYKSIAEKDYSPDMVTTMFILGLEKMVDTIEKNDASALEKIMITTDEYPIGDDCNLYFDAFDTMGWYIAKEKNAIALIKDINNYVNVELIPKLFSMLQEEAPLSKATALDAFMLNTLISGDNYIFPNVQEAWNDFRYEQENITIDMEQIYQHYEQFRVGASLVYAQCENLLRFDKLATIFPNARQIICKRTDCIKNEDLAPKDYSPSVITSKFITALKDSVSLIQQNKYSKLEKIMIATYVHEIGDDVDLSVQALNELGWYIGVASKAIVLIKNPARYVQYTLKPKVKAMISGEKTNPSATAFDAPLFRQLTTRDKGVPSDVQEIWDNFTEVQANITIDMRYMYYYYKLLIPKLFLESANHLQELLDTITAGFPHVAQITCKNADWKGQWLKLSMAREALREGLKKKLSNPTDNKWASLTKITIQTKFDRVLEASDLKTEAFNKWGWNIQQGTSNNAYSLNQITLTKQ